MYLAYLGQSGNTGNSPNDANQPHHVHAGLLVHESQSTSITGEFDALFLRHFGRARGGLGEPRAVRAGEVFQGMGVFSSWPQAKRHELIRDCLDILLRRETPVIVAFADKQEFADAGGGDSEAKQQSVSEAVIGRFLAALNLLMDEVNLAGVDPHDLMTVEFKTGDFVLVAASDRSIRPDLVTEFLRSDEGIDSATLLNDMVLVDAEHSVGAQLADMCAYFASRWLQDPAAPHPYFDALRDGNVIQVIYPVKP